MLYQLSYASAAQTERGYQMGTKTARAPQRNPCTYDTTLQKNQRIRARANKVILHPKPAGWKQFFFRPTQVWRGHCLSAKMPLAEAQGPDEISLANDGRSSGLGSRRGDRGNGLPLRTAQQLRARVVPPGFAYAGSRRGADTDLCGSRRPAPVRFLPTPPSCLAQRRAG